MTDRDNALPKTPAEWLGYFAFCAWPWPLISAIVWAFTDADTTAIYFSGWFATHIWIFALLILAAITRRTTSK